MWLGLGQWGCRSIQIWDIAAAGRLDMEAEKKAGKKKGFGWTKLVDLLRQKRLRDFGGEEGGAGREGIRILFQTSYIWQAYQKSKLRVSRWTSLVENCYLCTLQENLEGKPVILMELQLATGIFASIFDSLSVVMHKRTGPLYNPYIDSYQSQEGFKKCSGLQPKVCSE